MSKDQKRVLGDIFPCKCFAKLGMLELLDGWMLEPRSPLKKTGRGFCNAGSQVMKSFKHFSPDLAAALNTKQNGG
jgi:hypothetical protein